MASKIDGTKRTNLFHFQPENLTLVTDPNHPLYDPRVHEPVNEAFVLNVMAHGVLEPILIRRNGSEIIEVVAGRRRVKAALEANVRLAAQGLATISVPARLMIGNERSVMQMMIVENEIRLDDTVLGKAGKALRLITNGCTNDEVAIVFGVSVNQVGNWLALFELSENVRAKVSDGSISATAAIALKDMTREQQDVELEKILAGSAKPTVEKVREVAQKDAGKTVVRVQPKKKIFTYFQSIKENVKAPEEVVSMPGDAAYLKGYEEALAWVLRQGEPEGVEDAPASKAELEVA